MKPNEFIMNTDYLSIAQLDKYSYTYVLAGGEVPAYGQIVREGDFSIPALNGAIDQFMIRQGSGNYQIGHALSISVGGNDVGTLRVFRTSKTNLHVEAVLSNFISSTPLSFPTITFTIKITRFAPPNLF